MQAVLVETATDELALIEKPRLNLRNENMVLEQQVEIVGESKVEFALLQTSDHPGS